MMSKTNNTRPAHTHTHTRPVNQLDVTRFARCLAMMLHASLQGFPAATTLPRGNPFILSLSRQRRRRVSERDLAPPSALCLLVNGEINLSQCHRSTHTNTRLLKGVVWLLFCWCSALSVHSGKIRQRFWITCGACLVKDMLKVNADQKKKHLTIFTFLL